MSECVPECDSCIAHVKGSEHMCLVHAVFVCTNALHLANSVQKHLRRQSFMHESGAGVSLERMNPISKRPLRQLVSSAPSPARGRDHPWVRTGSQP